ncbi:class D sortase [Alkalicoccobacillus plakortidis]|uniref:Class D sortase n=1 Tax=Alkalicoccobacillus plakortidis TaxID=444060 RepID=A0ABT0XPM9_9BACI|nr:class D sortase [Alkalicoccobacillus plakortidis]MCM2677308.1 class D sortase [Alkalicoccobacillus plakortidis]
MKIVYSALILVGLTMTIYFGFQWVSGTQAAENLSQDEIEALETAKVERQEVENEESSLEEESDSVTDPVMSDEIDLYHVGAEMSRLVIPEIEKSYKTYWGTDDETLKQGVGMYVSQWTTTPDEKRHTVLSGHRDTVFSELGAVELGDVLYLEYEGQRYEYEIDDIWITDADDRTVIVDKDEATLTLTTCYPFDFVGSAPDRYIIQSKLVDIVEI